MLRGTYEFLNGEGSTDADLAAHITVLNNRGICVNGKPISEVFPFVPSSDYLLSIIGDFRDCLENIEEDPIYCTLNLIRVYWFIKEDVISSKQEAGDWGLATFPKEMNNTLKKVVECYASGKDTHGFNKDELVLLKNYISEHVHKQLNKQGNSILD